MNTKFLAVISVIALATVCVVQGQSPSPAESPAASPSPAEKAASPSPAESPAASPKATPTPKKAKPKPTPRPAVSPSPAGRAIDEAANPPAPGGGHGQVWVNPETGVYHRTGSRFYGTHQSASARAVRTRTASTARAPSERHTLSLQT